MGDSKPRISNPRQDSRWFARSCNEYLFHRVSDALVTSLPAIEQPTNCQREFSVLPSSIHLVWPNAPVPQNSDAEASYRFSPNRPARCPLDNRHPGIISCDRPGIDSASLQPLIGRGMVISLGKEKTKAAISLVTGLTRDDGDFLNQTTNDMPYDSMASFVIGMENALQLVVLS
jgi:hypothetical protein